MQQLRRATSGAPDCAAEILDSIPPVLQFIRAQMRRHSPSSLSIAQFRALVFLDRNAGTALSPLAGFLGLSLPAASRLVEDLVRQGHVVRATPRQNRRLVALTLSPRGRRTVDAARSHAHRRVAEAIAPLTQRQRAQMRVALRTLRGAVEAFAEPRTGRRRRAMTP